MGGWLVAVLLPALALAYVNGANDVSKGVATLVGGGVTSYRSAILWGAAWTGAGGLLAMVWARAMLRTFGEGLLAPSARPTLAAALAAVLGATAWVLLATLRSWPVSTTHAIVGSLVGVAATAHGLEGVAWGAALWKIALPLAVSPIASMALVALVLRGWRLRDAVLGERFDCLCGEVVPGPRVALQAPGRRTVHASSTGAWLRLTAGSEARCRAHGRSAVLLTVDRLHWLTSGMVSMARGMNDAPKMVALLAGAAALGGGAVSPGGVLFPLVALGMVAGGIASGRRVTSLLAERVTVMDGREGFVANLVTAGLVAAGALSGLPMSTTHVSCGSIIGSGAQRTPCRIDVDAVRSMLLAWVVTVPAAACLGVIGYVAVSPLAA